MHLPLQVWSVFVTLLATIGPVETSATFAGLTAGVNRKERTRLASHAVIIAGCVLILFALAGNLALDLLHISLAAFQVAGGILLFLQALALTFSKSGLSSINPQEIHDAKRLGNIAVFPLAFPIIAGPGSLSAVVLLMGRIEGWGNALIIVLLLVLCLGLTLVAMLASDRLSEWLGETGTDVVGRLSGVLLAGLAVQFVFDGLKLAFEL